MVRRQSELDTALSNGEIPVVVAHGLFVVCGDANVYARCGMIDAGGRARVVAVEEAAVRVGDRACVWSRDGVRVDAYDQAIVVASGGSRVRAADNAQVFADGRAEIALVGDARAYCVQDAEVTANGRSRVHASRSVRVLAGEHAVVCPAVSSWVAARRAETAGPDPELADPTAWKEGTPSRVS